MMGGLARRITALSRELCKICLLLLFCLRACGAPPSAQPSPEAPPRRTSSLWQVQVFSSDWTYRLGASPRLPNGQWLWAQPELTDDWQRPPRVDVAPLMYGQREM